MIGIAKLLQFRKRRYEADYEGDDYEQGDEEEEEEDKKYVMIITTEYTNDFISFAFGSICILRYNSLKIRGYYKFQLRPRAKDLIDHKPSASSSNELYGHNWSALCPLHVHPS